MKQFLLIAVSGLATAVLLTAGAGEGTAEELDGAALFMQRTCFTCHGKDAKTPILPMYPKLAGQNAEYAYQQMMDIKNGVRTNGLSVAMKAIMHLVSDDEVKILAEYLSTLEP